MNICGETFQEEQIRRQIQFQEELFGSYQENKLLVKRRMNGHPRRLMKKRAKEMDISDGSLRRIMKGGLVLRYTISNYQSCPEGPPSKTSWLREGNVKWDPVTNYGFFFF